ncbi:hypothetical protein IM697_00540 [Streptomyces ferrugineus]|uniref:Uncharacterized protein n=1 Tax=Streptomyces ferrugineus TaxID=1413221 RepID=A0A7M2SKV3_9ACTN|nr:hypothetical protein [Streptomyces ferrugineus]QOV37000.1 hypothetical protein IM697_00540 [Streptomyces ferrugineus]
MRDLIRPLAEWLRLLLAPGTGKRRAGVQSAAWCPISPHSTAVPDPACLSLPLHRSPYGLHLPLDGAECRLVRPYLTDHEQECARRRRHLALVPAADTMADLDRHLIGAKEVTA